MKSFGRLSILGVISLIVLTVAASPFAYSATELTADQRQHIQTNCSSIKAIVSQLRASDALLRVNRGQLYESIGTKLMDRFNGRLDSNSINLDDFSSTTTIYRQSLTNFRSDYIAYAGQLTKTLSIDCQTQPDEFHSAVETSRELRKKVRSSVVALNTAITNYQTHVNNFQQNYDKATNGVGL